MWGMFKEVVAFPVMINMCAESRLYVERFVMVKPERNCREEWVPAIPFWFGFKAISFLCYASVIQPF